MVMIIRTLDLELDLPEILVCGSRKKKRTRRRQSEGGKVVKEDEGLPQHVVFHVVRARSSHDATSQGRDHLLLILLALSWTLHRTLIRGHLVGPKAL